MALKIYGVARSRTFRTLWMAEELGIPYEHVKVDFADGGTRRPDYLAINPNGHIPSIDDNGFRLWESMAINLYLAKKYGSGAAGLYPQSLDDEARAWQWSFWGMTEVERSALTVLLNRIGPEDRRDAAAADGRSRARSRDTAQGARCGGDNNSVPARPALHRSRSQCREHSRLGAPGEGQPRRFPQSRSMAEILP
ncbi:MAG: glutathione S-transferase [Alphaproteobacteria bacterium]|nr:glutathione S-transferase [Alphaproteobacteria bacterium]